MAIVQPMYTFIAHDYLALEPISLFSFYFPLPPTPALNTFGSSALPIPQSIPIDPEIKIAAPTPMLAKRRNGTLISFFSHAPPPH